MYRFFLKRAIDIVLSLLAIPFVFVAIIIFGPIIFLSDRGPIFYCGKRVGKNGKPFKMVKFRSMRVNAPDIRLEDGSTYNGENDPRVTRIGRFLRKTSIDELPQFFNVFVGDMSIIGPRPDPLDWLSKYPDDVKVFLKVRPGITGYSSAFFRNSVDGYAKMQNDVYYATHVSFWFDIKIFLKTIITVFKHENTYKTVSEERAVKEYGYEFDVTIDEDTYKNSFGKCTFERFRGAYALRSGRDALKAVSREYDHPCVALLPSLSCDSMVRPFKMYGHKVVFYKLKEDASIDLGHLRSLIRENHDKTILFLYMDYFGAKAISKKQLSTLRRENPNIIFINDITHTYLSHDFRSAFKADFVIASVRKWLGIPDGGLLWCKKRLVDESFSEDTSFAYKHLEAQQLRHKYLMTGDAELKKTFREIFSNVTAIIDDDVRPARMSSLSFSILKKTDFRSVYKTRKANAKELITLLRGCRKIKPFPHHSLSKSYLYVPYLINDRDFKQKEMSKSGIFNTIIWPISDEQSRVCKNAKYIETHMLAAPCDQRYTVVDMFFVGREIVRIIDE